MNGNIGYGYPQKTIEAPDSGLYYMWIYLAGNNIRNLYGYILVDNLEPEIALDTISLPKTKEVELGKTITLTPTFSPENTTNKIVTWSSSDESVATVDNTGKVTPKKVGATIITVTSQDGKKKATCTVTVVETLNNNKENNNNPGTDSNKSNENIGLPNEEKDDTIATEELPKAGIDIRIILTIALLIGGSTLAYINYNKYRGI